MSKTTVARRIALLASSSLGLALIASTTTAGLALAPTQAAAQAVCVPIPTTGAGTNNVSYGGSLYATGIACDANGDMTVATTSSGVDIGGPGIDLDATGVDDITFNSTVEIDGNGLTGALIEATTDSGMITINAAALDADQTAATSMTHGILATSTTGAIDINLTGTLDAEASGGNLGGIAGIEARTGGAGGIEVTATSVSGRLYGLWAETTGTGDITITSGNFGSQSTSGEAGIFADAQGGGNISITGGGTGGLYGIRARTTGAGDLTIAGASSSTGNVAGDQAAIDARTGTGLLRIDMTGNVGNSGGDRTGSALRIVTGGDAELNFRNLLAPGFIAPIVDMTTQAGTLTTLTHSGLVQGGTSGSGAAGPSALAFRGAGGGDFLIQSNGGVLGRVDFSTATGDLTWNIGSTWRTSQNSYFGAGNDSVSIASNASFQALHGALSAGVPEAKESVTIDFGGGTDVFVNEGTWFVGARYANSFLDPDLQQLEAELSLLNLERLENSGTILFGEFFAATTMTTDQNTDDIILMPGGTFIGSGDSLMLMDVNLNSLGQGACDPALRDAEFTMPGADCLGIVGGATEGVTRIRVFDKTPGDRGAYSAEGIVLVDVSGGTSEASHFVLDPDSPGYDPVVGGINKGLFFYPLVYDVETQQHKLAPGLTGGALQYPALAQAAHGVWRLATGTWLDRQADLRGGLEEGYGGGVWIRGSTEFVDRDLIQTSEVAGVGFDFDNTYNQSSYAVTVGLDVLSGTSGDTAYGLGVMGGYTHSDLDFEASPNRAQFDGWSLGAYASFISGGLFIDAALNGNKLIMDHDVPSLNLVPVGTITSTNLASVGGQLEAGWRIPLMERAFVEPLAGVNYVRSKFDDLSIAPDDSSRPGIDVEFDDPTSLRAGVGARLGLDQNYGPWQAQYSILGRIWNEFEDETGAVLHNVGDDAFASNDFSGQFTEFGVGVSFYGFDGAANGFMKFGGQFGDDYAAQTGSVGVRVNW